MLVRCVFVIRNWSWIIWVLCVALGFCRNVSLFASPAASECKSRAVSGSCLNT
uniref:Uncharacterized protein n=1 Tax=Setaria viridis TaxID=4556 RepID=A0A4V6Y7Q5_SETVI|nr:hypothetical protein SEVIR_9G217433v2 [Setaria viridis]